MTPPIQTLAETGSTNDDLLARAAAGAPEGTWLRADCQTGGKGRHGRSWISPPGNLYASTLIRLRPTDPSAPTLALLAAVALHEALATPGLHIKWPNDIMAGPAKLAGILLERAGDSVVIGFGANLAHAPQDLPRLTISLAALTGTPQDPVRTTQTLAETTARWLVRWRIEGLAPVRTAWLAAAHPVGTRLQTAAGEGTFDGLTQDGALCFRRPDASLHVIHAGDVFEI